MDINEFEEQARISLAAVFTGSADADLQCVLAYLAPIPDELAFPLLLDFIGQYPKLSELQVQNIKRVIEVKAHNIEINLKWMKKLLQRIPDDPALALTKEYFRRYKKYPNGRSANIWLRKSVEFIDKVIRKFPVSFIT